MKHVIYQIRSFWIGLSENGAVFLGLALGVLFGIVPHAVFNWPVMVPGFFVYFPFHAWLCFLLFSVFLSQQKRSRIMGEGYSPMGAFFSFLITTKYGLFCISWFFSMWLYWASVMGI